MNRQGMNRRNKQTAISLVGSHTNPSAPQKITGKIALQDSLDLLFSEFSEIVAIQLRQKPAE